MSIEQLKREVASLGGREQAELISYTLQLRHAHDPNYRQEVTGDKAIVPLGLKNTFNQGVNAAWAAVWLLDEQGKRSANPPIE